MFFFSFFVCITINNVLWYSRNFVITGCLFGPPEMKNRRMFTCKFSKFDVIISKIVFILTKLFRCASFSKTTCVCCGVNFKTAAITLINVVLFELMLLVKYWKKWVYYELLMASPFEGWKWRLNADSNLEHNVFQIFKFCVCSYVIRMMHWNLKIFNKVHVNIAVGEKLRFLDADSNDDHKTEQKLETEIPKTNIAESGWGIQNSNHLRSP